MAVPPDPEAVALGSRIRQLRQKSGRSLREVASSAELTVSFLSRLERGQTGVTVDSLRRIADVLQVQIVDFFGRDDTPRPLLIRSGHGPVLDVDTPGHRTTSETLIPRAGSALQATLYRSPAGGGRTVPFSHPGEELIYVVEGTVTYQVGDQSYELSAGDALWHPSVTPHSWEAGGEGAVTLNVNTPPAW